MFTAFVSKGLGMLVVSSILASGFRTPAPSLLYRQPLWRLPSLRAQLAARGLIQSVVPDTTLLVVGDGDLSFSASVAPALAEKRIRLVATVLEMQDIHNIVYANSKQNSELIDSHPLHTVRFGIDATKLSEYFGDERFDRIVFNFPHWRGKANTKYNRELLADFLESASGHVRPDSGEIHVALCEGQGGSEATSLREWKGSWMAGMFAGEAGLMLRRTVPFSESYNLSAHRGVDRPFSLGKKPLTYIFGLPNGHTVPEELRNAFRHQLRVEVDDKALMAANVSEQEVFHGDFIQDLLRSVLVEFPGIVGHVPMRDIVVSEKLKHPLVVFLVIYSGSEASLSKQLAKTIRSRLEETVTTRLNVRVAQPGWSLSKAFPYPLWKCLLHDFANKSEYKSSRSDPK